MNIKAFLTALAALILLPLVPMLRDSHLARAGTEAPKKILAIQSQTFAPYESSFRGFQQGLEESDYSGKIEVERFNAQSDLNSLKAKVLEVKKEKGVDLIFTLGTRATQEAIAAIDDIPIVFTDLGAPEYSGIIKDWKSSGSNVTGVETPKYLSKGVDLLHQLMPFRNIGMLYLENSPSHEGAVRQLRLASKNLGAKLIYDGFPLKTDAGVDIPDDEVRASISRKLNNILPRVDVFFIQPSRAFVDNFDLFLDGFKRHNVISAGDPVYIKMGLVLGLGRNKFEFGKQCARYAVKIFRGKPPARLPMDVGKRFSISFNLKASAVVGFVPPLDILGAADAIYQDFHEVNH